MRERYVVDTNVLIAASAADPAHPHDIGATPDDPELRHQIWQWLDNFQQSNSRLILDDAGEILKEYQRQLGFNDFGIQVVMHKFSTAAVDNVDLEYDTEGNAELPVTLRNVIHDNADKKMVAAALACQQKFGEACVAFAGDTDWHDWERALFAHQIILEPIIENWSRQKHAEKHARKHEQKP